MFILLWYLCRLGYVVDKEIGTEFFRAENSIREVEIAFRW